MSNHIVFLYHLNLNLNHALCVCYADFLNVLNSLAVNLTFFGLPLTMIVAFCKLTFHLLLVAFKA